MNYALCDSKINSEKAYSNYSDIHLLDHSNLNHKFQPSFYDA